MMIKPIVYDSQYLHVHMHAALREKRKGKAGTIGRNKREGWIF